MGNHVIYLRKAVENELKAEGHDPGDWAREVIKREIEARAAARQETASQRLPNPGAPLLRPEKREIVPDFRERDKS